MEIDGVNKPLNASNKGIDTPDSDFESVPQQILTEPPRRYSPNLLIPKGKPRLLYDGPIAVTPSPAKKGVYRFEPAQYKYRTNVPLECFCAPLIKPPI